MAEPLLDVRNLTKRFGGFVALDEVSVQVNRGERFGLIGPNGSGKTTLINCVSGALGGYSGRIVFAGTDLMGLRAYQRTRLGIARSFQIPRPFTTMSVLENLAVPLEYSRRSAAYRGDPPKRAMEILALVGMEDKADANSGELNQIEMRKLELARALAATPDLLISDEAMAGLSSSEVDDILEALRRLNGLGITVIMIEHIMRAVMGFSERIAVLDAGRKIAEGTPEEIARNPEVERAYLGQ